MSAGEGALRRGTGTLGPCRRVGDGAAAVGNSQTVKRDQQAAQHVQCGHPCAHAHPQNEATSPQTPVGAPGRPCSSGPNADTPRCPCGQTGPRSMACGSRATWRDPEKARGPGTHCSTTTLKNTPRSGRSRGHAGLYPPEGPARGPQTQGGPEGGRSGTGRGWMGPEGTMAEGTGFALEVTKVL